MLVPGQQEWPGNLQIVIMNGSLKYGLLAGGVTILYLLVFYFIDPRIMLSSWVLWSSMVIYVTFMVLACRRRQVERDGKIDFKEALQSAFLVFVVANVAYYLFYYLMFSVFDPGLAAIQREIMLENLENLGSVLDEQQREEMLRNLQEQDLDVRPFDLLLSFGQGLIGGFIIALVIAGLFSRNPVRVD